MIEPAGEGWARGLNRVTQFYSWQIAAGFLALVIWLTGRAFERGSMGRWLCRLPIALAALLFLATAGVIAWANYSKPSPNTDYLADETRPVAAPAPAVKPLVNPAPDPDE